MEVIHDPTGVGQHQNAGLDDGDGDGFGLAQMITGRGHQPRNGSGRRDLLQLLV